MYRQISQDEKKELQQLSVQMGVLLEERQLELFVKFYEYLIKANEVMNLTAITEWKDVVLKHFVDSLSLVRAADLSSAKRIADLGTGAGFPGIPLKIAFPQLELVLMDSLNKRVLFINAFIRDCGLKHIMAVHGRAEELGRRKEYREGFDLCVSRAVANLSTLSEYCLPLVRTGGSFISYKGGQAGEETEQALPAIRKLGGGDPKVDTFCLPGTDIGRSLICIPKTKKTPGTYPRRPGMPGKEPL